MALINTTSKESNMFKVVTASLIPVVVASFASVAEASTEYNVTAAACVADRSAIEPDLYFASGGQVTFNSTATGDIVLYCSMPILPFTPGLIDISYVDQGGDANNHVTAQWIEMDYVTGAITSISTADSRNGLHGDLSHHVGGTKFTHPYSPESKAYYIRIDIRRNTTTPTETVSGVFISV